MRLWLRNLRQKTNMTVRYQLYQGYVALYNLDLPMRIKHRMFGELCSGLNPDHWRVVGMTELALQEFIANNFDRPKTVCRAHKVSRLETSKEMFEGPLMSFDEWWELYYERDKTVLATKSENMQKATEVQAYDVPAGLFVSKGYAFRVSKDEKAFLKEKVESNV